MRWATQRTSPAAACETCCSALGRRTSTLRPMQLRSWYSWRFRVREARIPRLSARTSAWCWSSIRSMTFAPRRKSRPSGTMERTAMVAGPIRCASPATRARTCCAATSASTACCWMRCGLRQAIRSRSACWTTLAGRATSRCGWCERSAIEAAVHRGQAAHAARGAVCRAAGVHH